MRELAPLSVAAHERLTTALFEELGVASAPVASGDGFVWKLPSPGQEVRIEGARTDAPMLVVYEWLGPWRAVLETMCLVVVGFFSAAPWFGVSGVAVVAVAAAVYYRGRSTTVLEEERRELEAFVHRLAARAPQRERSIAGRGVEGCSAEGVAAAGLGNRRDRLP